MADRQSSTRCTSRAQQRIRRGAIGYPNDFLDGNAAKALPRDALVEITGKLRHDRWQDQATKAWRGKIHIAVEPGEGSVRSKGLATAGEAA
jgi:hypothetical protein